MVQWLRLHAFTAMGSGSNPNQGTKIPQAAQYSHPKKKNKQTNKQTNKRERDRRDVGGRFKREGTYV